MNVEEAFEPQITMKPDSDTFIVFALDEEEYNNGDGGFMKLAVDFNNLEEFYQRINKRYECVEFHEDTVIPVLKEK